MLRYTEKILNTPTNRQNFETFKSNVCHLVKDLGDAEFVIEILESDIIREMYNRAWYPESFYLLAMTDYLCRENGVAVALEYADIRQQKLTTTIYPSGIMLMSRLKKSEKPKEKALSECIPEFRHFNIIESDIRNVC
jgi:hypothetical protein